MNEEQRKLAEKIFQTISGQRFADWYNTGQFDDYITCRYPTEDPRQPTREQVLESIVKLFHL